MEPEKNMERNTHTPPCCCLIRSVPASGAVSNAILPVICGQRKTTTQQLLMLLLLLETVIVAHVRGYINSIDRRAGAALQCIAHTL